jgi:hypothetical protein
MQEVIAQAEALLGRMGADRLPEAAAEAAVYAHGLADWLLHLPTYGASSEW